MVNITRFLQSLGILPAPRPLVSPLGEPEPRREKPDPLIERGWEKVGPNRYRWPTPTPTPYKNYFGVGTEPAYIAPELYDAIVSLNATDEEKMALAELAGQESSYGYAGPHISEKERSYGPFHINLLARRINPLTGLPFTREEAEDVKNVVKYALEQYRKTGGLGSWNPGAYPFYQYEIPKRARRKRFIRGKKKK